MLLPWATTSTAPPRRPARQQVGDDGVLPVGEDPPDHVGQALGGRQRAGRNVAVAGVVGRVALVAGLQRRRGDVVAAPPHLHLVGPYSSAVSFLFLPLQGAVVALVQPPVAADRQPAPPGGVEGQVGRADGPGQHRGVDHPQVEIAVSAARRRPGPAGLGLAGRGQVDVGPAGEEVLGVPGGLAVAEEDEVQHGRAYQRRRRPGVGGDLGSPRGQFGSPGHGRSQGCRHRSSGVVS